MAIAEDQRYAMMIRNIFNRIRSNNENGAEIVNVFSMPTYIEGQTDINDWIQIGIDGFKEWYQPVNFGDGIYAHVTAPPTWKVVPALDGVRGTAKWEYIVKRHMPDLVGKRVLDLGCNNGVFSLQLARMGAREVVGIDRDRMIRQKSSRVLPVQDIIAQANFVKQAAEIKEKRKYPIKYLAHDIARIPELDMGRFDLILALCIVYHELGNTPCLIQQLSEMTDNIVLQTTLLHGGELAKWASPYLLAELLVKAGYTRVEIDAPVNYSWPMIIGKR